MSEFKLEFSENTLPFDKNTNIIQVKGKSTAYAITNNTLYEFEFSKNNQPKTRAFKTSNKPLGTARLLHAESIDAEHIAVIVKVPEGIRFYVHSKEKLVLAFEDDLFHDVFGWNNKENTIHLEHFYANLHLLGMMTFHTKYGTKFYIVKKEALLSGDYPIHNLETNLGFLDNESPNSFLRMPVNFGNIAYLSIMSRNTDGLCFFAFNPKNELELLKKTPLQGSVDSMDKIFITNLNNQKLNDIVHFNSSGMFIYGFLDTIKFSHFNPLFSKEQGWTKDHLETIKFGDINFDMVFTGPSGLDAVTFDRFENIWSSVIETSKLSSSMRHSRVNFVASIINTESSDSYIFSSISDSLTWAKAVPLLLNSSIAIVSSESKYQGINATSNMTPILRKVSKPQQPSYLLRDMNIWSQIRNCISPVTGKPKFSISLVDLPDPALKFNVNYDATNSVNDILGIGWSMQLNFITMDDQGSIFEEDETFTIALQDASYSLKHNVSESNPEVQVYSIPTNNGNSAFQASFEISADKWTVNLGNGFKHIYGHIRNTGQGAISRDIVWKNWNGAGYDSEDRLQRTRVWYLAQIQNTSNKTMLEFNYDIVTVNVSPGLEYTKSVVLNKSRDYQGNEIEFRYQEKNPDEYVTYDPKDQFGNVNWVPINTRYLAGYTLRTPSRGRDQNVDFTYRTVNGNRFLVEIRQSEDETKRPVATFAYLTFPKKQFVLQQANLPNDVQVEFRYTPIGENNSDLDIKRLQVFPDYKVTIDQNYVLVSFLNGKSPNQVVLRMFNRDMTKELYTSDPNVKVTTKGRWPLLGEYGAVVGHDVFRGDGYFGLILFYTTSKRVCLFGYDILSDIWLKESVCREYSEETDIQPGGSFFLVSDPNSSVDLFEWNFETKTWDRKTIIAEPRKTAISVYKNRYVTYDNKKLSLGYKSGNGTLIYETLVTFENCLSGSKRVFNRFNLEENIQKIYSVAFQNNVLKFRENLIALNCLGLHDQSLRSSLKLFTLDRHRKISNQTEIIVQQDDFRNFVSDEEKDKFGNFFKFKYQIASNGKFDIKVHSFRGSLMDMLKQNPNSMSRTQITERVEKAMNLSAKWLLIKFQDYIMSFSDKIIMIRDQKVIFGGSKWQQTTVSEKERSMDEVTIVGDKFILDKSNNTVALLRKKTREVVLKPKAGLKDMKLFYPIYLVIHANNTAVQLVEFDDNEVNKKSLPISETFSPYSNHRMLVTSEGFKEQKVVVLRNQYGLSKFLPNHVISNVTVIFDNDKKKRISGYEFDPDSARLVGKTVLYSKVSFIPGNKKRANGWLEQSFINGSVLAFNGDGEFVRQISPTEKHSSSDNLSEAEMAFRADTTIYSKSGNLEIAVCTPYRTVDEVVAYYGFEDYEQNIIGRSKNWTIKSSNIIRNGFALTGRNFLRQQTESIEGVFQPLYQSYEYTVSTWVRFQNNSTVPDIGQITPCLQAVVGTTSGGVLSTLLSVVKFRLDDWVYLELIADLAFLRGKMDKETTENLQLNVRIGPMTGTSIDIDHIRFAPLVADFSVKVFDSETELNTAIISSTGSITRTFYDHYDTAISEINEDNQIEELITYTKATVPAALISPSCSVHIKPDSGFYEQFDPFSFVKTWKITKPNDWSIEPFILEHNGNGYDSLELITNDISLESYGFRLLYALVSDNAILSIIDKVELFKTKNQGTLRANRLLYKIPKTGEILMIKEKTRLLVWIDGVLYADKALEISDKPLRFVMHGKVNIRNTMIFSKGQVKVTYRNSLGEPTQEISLESAESMIVKEMLYDELGRQRMTTMDVRLVRYTFESLLQFLSNFVTNDGLDDSDSVWKTGLLNGLATKITENPYCFTETKFNNNPINEKIVVGLPGRNFSSNGKFAQRFAYKTSNIFIKKHFSEGQNVSFHVKIKNYGAEDINVLDNRNRLIAQLIHIPGNKDLFSTYKWNEDGNPTQVLPPLYFEKVGYFHKINSDLLEVNKEDLVLQKKLGTHTEYNKNGKPIRKTTADAGPSESIYDSHSRLRFVLYYSYSKPSLLETIIYFNYDPLGRIISSGEFLDLKISKDDLLKTPLTEGNSVEYQKFDYANFERNPNLRGRLMRTITRNGDEPFAEVLYASKRGSALEKRIILPSLTAKTLEIAIKKTYSNGRLRSISYPADFLQEPFIIVYGYDRLGRVNSIGTPGEPNRFLKTTHNAAGQLLEENFVSTSMYSFKNQREYNEPGFLEKLKNPFQAEEISYTDFSYGGTTRSDGSVARIKYHSNWHDNNSPKKIGLHPNSFVSTSMSLRDSEMCFEALKKSGYLDKQNRQVRQFYPFLEVEFPIVCTSGTTGRHVSNILGQQGFPSEHGYRLDYGAHEDLTKAKYFVGSNEPDPLQPDTFSKYISAIDPKSSNRIWTSLKKAGFLVEDPDKMNLKTSHGKQGPRSIINSKLFLDLKLLNVEYSTFVGPVKNLLTSRYTKRLENISLLQMQDIFQKWLGNSSVNFAKRAAADIHEMLRQKQYRTRPLDPEFENILRDFKNYLPQIVGILFKHFGTQLGRSEFDVESYKIDSNGNHRNFNTGFSHYSLDYESDSNRVNCVWVKSFDSHQPEKTLKMKHDSRGNVIQALHKRIDSMKYHPVSNLLEQVNMVDGSVITFFYDSNGKRVLKRLTGSDGKIRSEMHYVRDDLGRTLVERKLNFIEENQPPLVTVTMYVFGENGLVGFVRRDQFYSVLTDHQGSVKLIVRNGEVVAAYDYLPYGEMMRTYGPDPEAHIPYRYTGQEWDPEIGLYNFHARLYDPCIGRFYQIDRKEQYFSPYKYAGNSPISMIDPTGEFAFIAIFLGVIGAWSGGAAVNDSFNPFDWKFNWKTISAVGFGFLTGYLTPPGFSASVAAVGSTLGIGYVSSVAVVSASGVFMAYWSTASATDKWNPLDWDLRDPKTINAIFNGYAQGTGIFAGINNAVHFYKGLQSTLRKVLFIGGSAGTFGAFFTIGGIASEWKINRPQFWYSFFSSAQIAPDVTVFGVHTSQTVSVGIKNTFFDTKEVIRKWRDYRAIFTNTMEEGNTWKTAIREVFKINPELGSIAKNIGKATGAGLSTYILSSALNNGFSNWNMTDISTYQNILTSIQLSGQFTMTQEDKLSAERSKLRLEKSEEALKLTNEIARKAKQVYLKYMEGLEVTLKMKGDQEDVKRVFHLFDPANPNYPPKVRTKLSLKEVPNTAMSIAVMEDNVLVAFSSNPAPTLYLVYSHDNLQNPEFRNRHIEQNNGQINGVDVRLSDNNLLNRVITDSINYGQETIKLNNLNEFQNEVKERFIELANTNTAENSARNIVNAVENQIRETGYVEMAFIRGRINEFEFNNANIQNIRDRIDLERIQIRELEDPERAKRLRNVLWDEKNLEQKLIPKERNEYANSLFQLVKHYKSELTFWVDTNCAEAHILIMLERHEGVFKQVYFPRKSYDVRADIQFLSTYKVGSLEPFNRCDKCLQSTSIVQNVLTEDDFMAKLRRETSELESRAKFNQQKWQYFMAPTMGYQRSITEAQEKKEHQDRRKRSEKLPKWYRNPMQWIRSSGVGKQKQINFDTFNSTANKTTVELGDEFLSKANLNGMLLLADVALAKYQHRKLHQKTSNSSADSLNQVSLMCNIVHMFEKSVEEAAETCGIDASQYNIDSYLMQQEVLPMLRKHNFHRMAQILLNYAVGSLERELPQRTVDKFSQVFESLRVNKSMEEMFFRQGQIPEIIRKKTDLPFESSRGEEAMTNLLSNIGLPNYRKCLLE